MKLDKIGKMKERLNLHETLLADEETSNADRAHSQFMVQQYKRLIGKRERIENMNNESAEDHLQHDIDAEDRKPNHVRIIRYGAKCEVLEQFEWPITQDTYDMFFMLRQAGKRTYFRGPTGQLKEG